jgi:hypothetical protein
LPSHPVDVVVAVRLQCTVRAGWQGATPLLDITINQRLGTTPTTTSITPPPLLLILPRPRTTSLAILSQVEKDIMDKTPTTPLQIHMVANRVESSFRHPKALINLREEVIPFMMRLRDLHPERVMVLLGRSGHEIALNDHTKGYGKY